MAFPKKILAKLSERKLKDEYRKLNVYPPSTTIDFFSNDYLGLAKNLSIHKNIDSSIIKNGATGSRLISGNSQLYNEIENFLAVFYHSESSLLFNCGYMANIGLLSTLPQRDDSIIYDQYSHASLRDGIRLSLAHSYSFQHNNYTDLEKKLQLAKGDRYVVVESLYSMDGDFSNLSILNDLCEKYDAHLIVDEAHSVGVYGQYGEGFSAQKKFNRIIARVSTFGKALGIHGAVICGGFELKEYLVNFCRPFIFTTGLPDSSLIYIKNAHEEVKKANLERENLQKNISYFKSKILSCSIHNQFLDSNSAIQGLLGEKSYLKKIETKLQNHNFGVKAIFNPTVEKGKERIRFCLHSYNTKEEMDILFNLL